MKGMVAIVRKCINVLHILGELKPSGAENMLISANKIWRNESILSDVLSTGDIEGVYAKSFKQNGFEVHHIPFNKSVGFFIKVFKLFKTQKYDIIHIHTERAAMWLALLAKISGIKCIIRTIHNNFQFSGFLRIKRTITRFISRLIGVRHIFIGKSVEDTEKKYFKNSGTTIPNWYNSNIFKLPTVEQKREARKKLNIDEEDFVVVTIGNCSKVKNHIPVIEAVSLIPQEYKVKYLHVGIEDKDQAERKLAEELNVTSRIEFLGFEKDILKILYAADVYIMPSLYEGFSIAALEALATGLPSIFSNVPGLIDLKDISSQIFYINNFSKIEIRDYILHLYNLTIEQRLSDSRNLAYKIQNNFSIEVGAGKYVELYKNILE